MKGNFGQDPEFSVAEVYSISTACASINKMLWRERGQRVWKKNIEGRNSALLAF